MILFLRAFFILVLVSMLAVTSWASMHTPLFKIPADVLQHPWFVATLLDAYWAFVTFYVWVAWKETSFAARVLWFVAIIALGNVAMSAYFLRELFRISSEDEVRRLFVQRNTGHAGFPAILSVFGVAIYFVA